MSFLPLLFNNNNKQPKNGEPMISPFYYLERVFRLRHGKGKTHRDRGVGKTRKLEFSGKNIRGERERERERGRERENLQSYVGGSH